MEGRLFFIMIDIYDDCLIVTSNPSKYDIQVHFSGTEIDQYNRLLCFVYLLFFFFLKDNSAGFLVYRMEVIIS